MDSEIITTNLLNSNYQLVPEGDENFTIINTCSFIRTAREETYNEITKALRRKRCGEIEKVFVAGCILQSHFAELENKFYGIDGYIQYPIKEGLDNLDELLEGAIRERGVILTVPHTAYLRISYGCDNNCSYCLIPKIRGRYRSRPIEEVVEEARRLAEAGVKELILISEDTAYYGSERDGKSDLSELLDRLNRIPQVEWIRLLYLNPSHISDEILETIASLEKILPYLDIPLQHISGRILRRMRRRELPSPPLEWIGRLRETIPDLALRTTFIVGFPGETEEEFERLLEFVGKSQITHIGAFAYSPEEGTASYELDDRVDKRDIERRLRRLYNLALTVSVKNKERFIGECQDVMIDGVYDGEIVGHSWLQAPDIDGGATITFEGDRNLREGEIVRGRLVAIRGHRLIYRIEDEPCQ